MYRSLQTPRDWTEHMTELLTTQGVPLVGVSTKETLAGGPPSTDLEYVLPGAKSAITFAVPLDQEKIELVVVLLQETVHLVSHELVDLTAKDLFVDCRDKPNGVVHFIILVRPVDHHKAISLLRPDRRRISEGVGQPP